ncbi:ABC transporter permease subunit [Paenibacillus sp. LMG 31460]|uniref:ABC transporter permease subunit n=1 Tax=Paenibacillus germinis TaxID=2654979 RepID=A0ABX1YWX6_9BACL|nr:carbohydrate ABC transporter permease [Paenibacillus germinis]NOU85620.1 ABC transporter permease subunit [Paenibacillus germinis]
MRRETSLAGRIFDAFNYACLTLFALVTVLPFVNIVASSFASEQEVLSREFILFPTDFSLDAYRYIFSTNTLLRSLLVTVYITIMGTFINIVCTSIMAYPLSRKDMIGRRWVMGMVLFTMLFGGGLIPNYLLVKQLGMLNSLWSVMIPGAIGAFALIIIKNFFQQMPEGIEESAKIDGCNDLAILFRIVLPLSMPVIATFSLFFAVGHWNTFMSAVIYINDSAKWPIQVLLRSIVIMSNSQFGDMGSVTDGENMVIPPETVKMAVITVATVPILLVYPFLQKHFAKGVLLGSVKG